MGSLRRLRRHCWFRSRALQRRDYRRNESHTIFLVPPGTWLLLCNNITSTGPCVPSPNICAAQKRSHHHRRLGQAVSFLLVEPPASMVVAAEGSALVAEGLGGCNHFLR